MALFFIDDSGHVRELDMCSPLALDWTLLQKSLIEEPSLASYPLDVIHERYESNTLAVYVDDGKQVVATCGATNKITDGIGAAVPALQERRIIEIGTCWIEPKLRGRGFFGQIQSTQEGQNAGSILFAHTYGLGERHVLRHENWLPISWDSIPYVSSLIGWATGDQFRLSSGLLVDKKIMSLWKTDDITDEESDRYHTLWCQNKAEFADTVAIDQEIAKLYEGDQGLSEFRQLVADELSLPH